MKNSWKAFPPIAILEVFRFGWKSVMTIEHSPLRKLDPRAGHMVFTILGFMWSSADPCTSCRILHILQDSAKIC